MDCSVSCSSRSFFFPDRSVALCGMWELKGQNIIQVLIFIFQTPYVIGQLNDVSWLGKIFRFKLILAFLVVLLSDH